MTGRDSWLCWKDSDVDTKEKGEPCLNKYFSPNDGKPIAWFERDSCKAHAVDGYDDYGQKLESATREKVLTCKNLHADAELKSKQQAAAQERLDRREQQAARRKRFQDIGRYIAEGRFGSLDGYEIALEECLVLRHETHLKFRIANLRDELKSYPTAVGRQRGAADALNRSPAGSRYGRRRRRRVHSSARSWRAGLDRRGIRARQRSWQLKYQVSKWQNPHCPCFLSTINTVRVETPSTYGESRSIFTDKPNREPPARD